MNKNSKTIALLLGLAAGAAMPLAAHAQATTIGGYAGGAFGQSEMLEYGCDSAAAFGGACKPKGTAYRFFAGYQFSRNWAIEVGYTDLGKASSNVPGLFDQVIKAKASDLTIIGSYPATERFSLFGKVGGYYGHTSNDFTTSGTTQIFKESTGNLTYGAGLQFFITEHLALRGEGQRYMKMKVSGGSKTDSDWGTYTVGLLWKFR